jgi:hypothetical protein
MLKFLDKNEYPSVRNNFDPDSNVTEKSDLHSEKQPSPKASTDEGIVISNKPVLQNAHPSIRDKVNPDANVTKESDLH